MPKDTLDLQDVVEIVKEVKSDFEQWKGSKDEEFAELKKKSGSADPVLTERITKIEEDLDKKQDLIDKFHLQTKRRVIKLDGEEIDQEELDAKAYNWAKLNARRRGEDVPEGKYDSEGLREYKNAFIKYLRRDDRVLTGDEQKALSVGSDPDGGYVVYPDMSGRMVKRIYETSPIRAYASTQVISTDALEGIHDVDEVTSGWVSETGTRAETDTPELAVWRIPVHEQYAMPYATQKILDDSAVDMESWLADKVADKMARTENTAFISGNGIGKPRGLLDYPDFATAGTPEIGAIERFDTGVNGAFAANPNGMDILIDLLEGMKDFYRGRSSWFMNRTTRALVRKLKDGDNNYLWQPSAQAGIPATLMGYPVVDFPDMPDPATDSLSVMFGDLASAYQIVERQGIRVLRDPYTSKPYVKFYTTKRVGGDVVDFDAVKLIEFTA